MTNGMLDAVCAIVGSVLIGVETNWKVGLGVFLVALATKR